MSSAVTLLEIEVLEREVEAARDSLIAVLTEWMSGDDPTPAQDLIAKVFRGSNRASESRLDLERSGEL